jgi:outer membrane protein assembly factor BamD (BamD/ComL family)
VTDFNGDGRLDLLVGDISGNFQGKPTQSAKERAEEEAAVRRLPESMKTWAATFQKYRELLTSPPAASPAEKEARARQLDALRQDLGRLKDEIAAAQKTIEHYQPQRQSHGYVWLFSRKPRPGKP